MPDKHLSSQFDNELNSVSSRLLEMGGLVESQIQQAVYALSLFVEDVANQVIETEKQVNAMEVEIDRELSTIIARRQPTAKDLRLLMAISKATANLERAGDEANKIARMVKSLMSSGSFRSLPSSELRLTTEMASGLLRKSLDAFARLDTSTALTILKEDDLMEDPRTISSSLDLLFVAKALERIGDHAKNIAELIIYIVKGEDVRHSSIEKIESTLQ